MTDDDRDLFEEAMAGVEPVTGPKPVLRKPAAPSPRERHGPPPPRFRVERDGSRVTGLAADRRPRTLGRLKGGHYPVEHRIDLHGLTEAEAREVVEDELLAAWGRGRRCALVIHGRGRHSAAGPVLKEALPDWLVADPLGRRVVAFATAPDRLGGLGATLVLLTVRR